MVRAEDQSLLKNALVSDLNSWTAWTGDRNSVISPGFKSGIWIDPKGDGSYDNEVSIDLGASYTIASVFIGAFWINEDTARSIGLSYILIGDDNSLFSNNLTLATTDPFHSGGFIDLDFPVKGRYVVIRRLGTGFESFFSYDWFYGICTIKVYAVTNLIQYGAGIHIASDASEAA